MIYNVAVYFIGASLKNTLKTTQSFTDRTRARQYAENELSYETTRRVVCPELDIDQAGDYEFTRWFDNIPESWYNTHIATIR